MSEKRIFYKRNLPHFQPDGGIYFITFRLAGSLPRNVIDEMKRKNADIEKSLMNDKIEKNKKQLLYNQRKRYFDKFDVLLGKSNTGPLWLRDIKVAGIVADAIHHRDEKEYDLQAFSIMPNHVHMLFVVTRNVVSSNPNGVRIYPVTKILQDLKKFTAVKANKILKRSGQFWHRESHDHLVRNAKEYNNILNYILQNPVKVGFVKIWEEWKWNYVKFL